MRHPHAVLLAGLATLVAAEDAQALSFGRVRSAVILGQPLNIAVPLVVAPGDDAIEPDCIRAEVLQGDSTVPPAAIRARLTDGGDEGTRIVRIATTVTIQEPVVTVTLHAGCPSKLTRTFTLLADPAVALAQATPPAAATAPAPQVQAQRPATSQPAADADAPLAVAPQPSPRPGPRRADVARPVAASPTPRPVPAAAEQPAAQRSRPVAQARPSAPERPRLQLESGSVAPGATAPPVVGQAAPAAERAASAAAGSAAAALEAASTAEARVKLLESEVQRLQASAKEQSDAFVRLQARVAQRPDNNEWLPWVAGLAALALALAGWMAWRMRKLAAEARSGAWWAREGQTSMMMESRTTDLAVDESNAASLAPPITMPPVTAAPTTMVMPAQMAAAQARYVSPEAPETIPAPAGAVAATMKRQTRSPMHSEMQAESHRAVSVDEQIDLEQQADFFIALGHDDAAIDLLLAHLRNTGGAAPMPYLKLLEMYRRRGDRDDYEVMRRRFNQRFNSIAPEWDHDGSAGRLLVDYPKQIARLQTAWPRPLDAMAELEAMAFGRGKGEELFDLPAYQDVLFLYQLARTLHDESAAAGTGVDVLLPIGTEPVPLMTTLSSTVATGAGAKHIELDLPPRTTMAPMAPMAMPQIDLDLPPLGKKLGR